MTDVKESGSYDNYLDKKVRLDDDYRATLDKHFDEYLNLPTKKQIILYQGTLLVTTGFIGVELDGGVLDKVLQVVLGAKGLLGL